MQRSKCVKWVTERIRERVWLVRCLCFVVVVVVVQYRQSYCSCGCIYCCCCFAFARTAASAAAAALRSLLCSCACLARSLSREPDDERTLAVRVPACTICVRPSSRFCCWLSVAICEILTQIPHTTNCTTITQQTQSALHGRLRCSRSCCPLLFPR